MKKINWNSRRIRVPAAILILVLAFAFLMPTRSGLTSWTGQIALTHKAAMRVDQALEKNVLVFTTVSAIKAATALVEGSSVGVGFDLEIGDLVQPAYDYIDFVWHMFLYSTLILTFYKQMLESGILSLGMQLLGVGLLIAAASLLWSKINLPVLQWARRFILTGLLIAYGLPLVLVLSDTVSRRYTLPLKNNAAEKISAAGKEFQQARAEFLSLKERISIMRPGESFAEVRDALMRIIERITTASWDSLGTFLYYVSILFFEMLFLPILMALLIYYFLSFALGGAPVKRIPMRAGPKRGPLPV